MSTWIRSWNKRAKHGVAHTVIPTAMSKSRILEYFTNNLYPRARLSSRRCWTFTEKGCTCAPWYCELYHDNAPSHTSLLLEEFLAERNIPIVPHPPYSPNMIPYVYFLLSMLKQKLKGSSKESPQGYKQLKRTRLPELLSEMAKLLRNSYSFWYIPRMGLLQKNNPQISN